MFLDAATIPENASKTLKTFKHANRFSRKLQRRLTRRTIDEASALKHQSAETLQTLIYLAKLVSLSFFIREILYLHHNIISLHSDVM